MTCSDATLLMTPTLTALQQRIDQSKSVSSQNLLYCEHIFRKYKNIFAFCYFSAKTWVVKSLQWLVYPAYLSPCLLMSWRREEPGHQQPWYWQVLHKIKSEGLKKRRILNFFFPENKHNALAPKRYFITKLSYCDAYISAVLFLRFSVKTGWVLSFLVIHVAWLSTQ